MVERKIQQQQLHDGKQDNDEPRHNNEQNMTKKTR